MFVFDLSYLERRGLRVICSTYGHGESPSAALKFHDRLIASTLPRPHRCRVRLIRHMRQQLPELHRGGVHIHSALTADGTTRLPEIGRLDAASRDDPSELATAWARREPKEYAND